MLALWWSLCESDTTKEPLSYFGIVFVSLPLGCPGGDPQRQRCVVVHIYSHISSRLKINVAMQ